MKELLGLFDIYIWRFIMFSVITNVYNKKTKGPTLNYLNGIVHSHRKTEKVFFFFGISRCTMCAPRVTRHTSIRYSSSSTVNGRPFHFLLVQTPSFSKLFIPRTNGPVCRRFLCVLCTKCTWHSNHRLTRVIFQHTK